MLLFCIAQIRHIVSFGNTAYSQLLFWNVLVNKHGEKLNTKKSHDY